MKKTGSLDAIHYDEQLIYDLWEELSDRSESCSVTFKIYSDSSTTEFESPKELQRATQIPDRISKFDFMLQGSEGRIRISASSSSHEYSISGEEDWVRRMTNYIREFNSEQAIKWRSILSNKNITFAQLPLFGALLWYSWEKIWGLINPVISIPISGLRWRIIFVLVAGIVFLQIAKIVYPAVIFRRKDASPRIRQALFLLMIVASAVSLLQGILWTVEVFG